MHKLARCVRFSVNPFLPEDEQGYNSYTSKPTGEGLAIFLELCVGVIGQVDPETGFVINVVDIDKHVREAVVPIFAARIRKDFRAGRHIGLSAVIELLNSAYTKLKSKFGKVMLGDLALKLNPYRKVAIDCEDWKMIYFSEKFEFAATHKLWNEDFSEERNFDVFGKCANPTGHGHNYIIEVTVKMPADRKDFKYGEFERIVDSELLSLVDHKNLNVDVPYFSGVLPTVENISVFAWERLSGKFDGSKLHCVTVWETEKTYCSYYG